MTAEQSERWAQFEQTMRMVDAAMRTEGVSASTAERVLSRVLYGGPDPNRVYRHEPISRPSATSFLFVWLDTALGGGPGASHCPKCRAPMNAITVGRDVTRPPWFWVEPCGCLFEVEPDPARRPPEPFPPKEVTFGTPVAPTQYLPMNESNPPEPTLSADWADRVLDQAPEVRRDA